VDGVFAGEKSFQQFQDWLPQESVDAMQEFRVSIKDTDYSVGGGIRSSTSLCGKCSISMRAFVPSAISRASELGKGAEKVDIVIFRENTEDVYAGIEWKAGSPEAEKLGAYLAKSSRVRFARSPPRYQADVRVRLEASRGRWRSAMPSPKTRSPLRSCTKATS